MEKLLHERLRELTTEEHYDIISVLGERLDCVGTGWQGVLNAIANEIERYYIPRPRFEDGEPVQFDDATSWQDCVEAMLFKSDGSYELHQKLKSKCGTSVVVYEPDELVKRPAPKVLDADGVEIKVGDEGWSALTGVKLDPVIGFHEDEFGMKVELENGFWIEPFMFTHEKPVFDAEGVRICKGDTVWFLHGDQHSFIVDRVFKDINGFLIAEVGSDGEETYYHPKNLTHREPDSLEKLLSDMMEDRRMCGSSYIPRIQSLIERGA